MAEESTEKSPYAKPGFVAAAVVVLVLVVIAVVVVVNAIRDSSAADDNANPAPTPTETETLEPEAEGGESVCGLDQVKMEGTVDTAPEASWVYLNDLGTPVSETEGPGNDSPSETMNCFARTPEGAVFAAAVGAAQLSSPEHYAGWAESNMVDGSARDEVLASTPTEQDPNGVETRSRVAGFKLLSYDGNTARVDLGISGSGNGNTVNLSMIVPLVWEDGDWKMSYGDEAMRPPAELPNLAGYNVWPE